MTLHTQHVIERRLKRTLEYSKVEQLANFEPILFKIDDNKILQFLASESLTMIYFNQAN